MGDVELSGDLIVENAVHNIDVCNWIADSKPVSAFGQGGKYFPEPIPAGTLMMDGFAVQYVYENGIHLDYSQLYMHPRALKKLQNGQWYMVYGQKGALDLGHESAEFYPMDANASRDLLTPELKVARKMPWVTFWPDTGGPAALCGRTYRSDRRFDRNHGSGSDLSQAHGYLDRTGR